MADRCWYMARMVPGSMMALSCLRADDAAAWEQQRYFELSRPLLSHGPRHGTCARTHAR